MTYFYRNIETDLWQWKNETEHFPLLIRGARQVGNSSVIREFGKTLIPAFFTVYCNLI